MTDEIESLLQIRSCSQIKDRQGAKFLLAIVRQLGEKLIAINESSTHGSDCLEGETEKRVKKSATISRKFYQQCHLCSDTYHSNSTGIKDVAIVGNSNVQTVS